MSLVFSFDDNIVVVTPIGFNTLEEMSSGFERIIADPKFRQPARILFDGRHTDYGPPGEELELLAEFLGKLDAFRDSHWAIVAIPDTLIFALSRMYCYLAEGYGMEAETFTDISKARQWLLRP